MAIYIYIRIRGLNLPSIAASAVTSLCTGLFFLLLGRFRLGNLVSFIPYPVVGGFLAGTGWFLVTGGIGGITNSLSKNEKMRERQQERINDMDVRKKECARWDDLHLLIGSADGKKFRNFAQWLTFERMTADANRRLQNMTDRYLLIRDASQPLELNVIDNYQAGEIRSTKNLSGGESFIVSLAGPGCRRV